MLEMRPNCEICDKDLPPEQTNALTCSFECTFCSECNDTTLHNVCPNCGGTLESRPTRIGEALARHPASTMRILKK